MRTVYESWAVRLGVIALFFALATVALDRAVLSSEERTIARAVTLEEAIGAARTDMESPLTYLVAVLGQGTLGQGVVAARVPFVLIGTAAVAVFAALMRVAGARYPAVWAAVLATNLAFLFFARSVSPVTALSLVVVVLLFLVLRWRASLTVPTYEEIFVAAVVFMVLPMTHWYGLVVLMVLEIPVIAALSSNVVERRAKILAWAACHSLLLVHLITWADVERDLIGAGLVPRTIGVSSAGDFTAGDAGRILGVVTGGGWVGAGLLAALVGATVVATRRAGDADDRPASHQLGVAAALCGALIAGLFLVAVLVPTTTLILARLYAVLVVPILVILAWAVEQLLANRHRVLRGVAVTVATAVLVFNGVTAVPYLVTQAPINDWSIVAHRIEELQDVAKRRQSTNLVTAVADIRRELRDYDLRVETLPSAEVLERRVACCGDELVHIEVQAEGGFTTPTEISARSLMGLPEIMSLQVDPVLVYLDVLQVRPILSYIEPRMRALIFTRPISGGVSSSVHHGTQVPVRERVTAADSRISDVHD